jgi:tetratricopeptide (TPR) repeat protein
VVGRLLRALWLVLLLLASGCAGSARLALPSDGGDAWLELRSKHFTTFTDLDRAEAARVVAELEQKYALLDAALLRGSAAPHFTTRVVVLRTQDEGIEFLGNAGGKFRPQLADDIEPMPTLIVAGQLSPFARTSLAHELTHRLSRVALGSLPTWLSEGLAQYYSTIGGDPSAPVVGESDPVNVAASGSVRGTPSALILGGELIQVAHLPKASALIALDREAFYAKAFDGGRPAYEAERASKHHYLTAWALVHFLLHADHDYAAKFRATFDSRKPGRSTGLELQALLGAVSAPRLDRDFLAYVEEPIPWRERSDPPAPEVPELVVRELRDGETLTLWARLDGFHGKDAARARQRLARAFELAPEDPDVLLWTGRYLAGTGDFRTAEARFKKAKALEPERGEILMALSDLYLDRRNNFAPGEREAGRRETVQALHRVARSAGELDLLAVHALLSSDGSDALSLAERACKAGPDCWVCFHTAAVAAYAKGDIARAVALEGDALALLPEWSGAHPARVVRETFERFRAEANGAPRGSTSPTLIRY